MRNGAEVVADALMGSLLAGETFQLPSINLNDPAFEFPSIVGNPLYTQVSKLTNEDLTTRNVGGTGTFDAIMQSQANHLKAEFTAGRITGADYAKSYVALSQSACGQAVQFLLGKDQAYWASVLAQGQALTARVQLETAKAQLAIAVIEANNQRAAFALNKLRLANEDAQYGIAKYTLATKLPAEVEMLASQKLGIEKNTEIAAYTLKYLNPAQLTLLKEQGEVQRAQTLDNRSDGAAVTGSVKSQKDLYAQQVISYQRSSTLNAAKVFVDAFTAESALTDGGGTAPTAIGSGNIQAVLTALQTINGL